MKDWEQLLAETDRNARIDRAYTLGKSLTSKQAQGILAILASGEPREQGLAICVLRAKDNWEPRQFAQYVGLLQRVIQERYPNDEIGPVAMNALVCADVGAANKVLEGVKVDGLAFQVARGVIRDMAYLGPGFGAFERLVAIEEAGGELGRFAGKKRRARLELSGQLSEDRRRELSDRWLRERSPEALSQLYHLYLSNLPRGTKKSEIVKLLGKPDENKKTVFKYTPSEWTSLYIEFDSTGLVGMSLSS